MSPRGGHRSPRRTPAPEPPQRWSLERPPAVATQDAGLGGLLTVVPLIGTAASMTVMLLFRGSGLALVGASMMLATLLASALVAGGQRGRAVRQRRAQRASYLSYMEWMRSTLTGVEVDRSGVLHRAQPPCRSLPLLVGRRRRLWERRPADADFLRVRLGTGAVPLVHLEPCGEPDPLRPPDEFMQAEMERLRRRFESTPGSPVELDLAGAGVVSVVGDRAFCERVARLMLAQATVFSSPDDLHLALFIPPRHRGRWGWARWLPHLLDPTQPTPAGPRPRVASSAAGLRRLLREDLQQRVEVTARRRVARGSSAPVVQGPALVIVGDQQGQAAHDLLADLPGSSAAELGLTIVHLLSCLGDEPPDVAVRVHQVGPHESRARLECYERRDGLPARQQLCLDEWGRAEGAALARSLAALRPTTDAGQEPDRPRRRDVIDLLGLRDDRGDDGGIDLARAWGARPPAALLRVPIGFDPAGDVVEVDLKEAGAGGMGPHGLCVGATGSGKSELLRTLVLSLLSSHSPHDIAMVLVDYKGGATFAPFTAAPQVHGVITNLGDDALLIDRVHASLTGEVRRRQEMLKAAGDLPHITEYRRRRAEAASAAESLDPMPHLLVIIDEFGELLTTRPDFIELFLSIGRIGRSIGVHLLLSSQRVEPGKLRGLETHLSYRIGLRTLSAAESHTVLETADAFSLPTSPGYAYLKVDSTVYRRFRAGYVSAALPRPDQHGSPRATLVQPVPFYGAEHEPAAWAGAGSEPVTPPSDQAGPRSGPSVLQTVMTALAGQDRQGPPIWLPPLAEQLTLDQIPAEAPGHRPPAASGERPVRAALGLLDEPARQWQGRWELDLSSGGHVLVVGGPRSGRTTTLRSLAASLALSHGPHEVAVYGLDATGTGLTALDRLPGVAGIGCRSAPEVIRRVVADVHTLLVRREELNRRSEDPERGHVEGARPGEHTGLAPPLRTGAEVVMVVDGLGPLCEEHPEVVERLHDLLRRGPAYGIRLVCTVSRRHEVRLQHQVGFTTVLELRLTDPAESGISRALAECLLDAPPGRCLLPSRQLAQVALPRIDGRADRASLDDGLAHLVDHVRSSATLTVPTVRVLPTVLTSDQITASARPGVVGLGLDEADFSTAVLDLDRTDRHLLLVGDPGTGKTSVLARVLSELVAQYADDELVVAQMDPQGALVDHVPAEYLGGYAGSTALAHRLVAAVATELEQRAHLAGDAVRRRDPALPRIVVAVDDYEVLTAGGASPLQPLVPYLSVAGQLGLNVVVSRCARGAARAAHEPVIAALRDGGATGLLFSADRADGQLFPSVRPESLPTGRALLIRPGGGVRTVQTARQHPR